MATSNYEIVTLTLVKEWMGIRETDASADEFLQRRIDNASRRIELYTGRKFKVQSITDELHDHEGGGVLYTDFFPIIQLSTEATPSDAQKLAALQHRADVDSAWENVETDVDHIIFSSDSPVLALYDTVFYAGTKTVKISYKAGWTTIPEDIQQVCFEMVQQDWDNSKRGGGRLGLQTSARSEGTANFSATYRDLWPSHKTILDYYRVRRIG